MRDLAIAYGNSRQAKKWSNKTVKFDNLLNAHSEWTDPTQLPTSSRESKANTVAQQKVQDPLEKDDSQDDNLNELIAEKAEKIHAEHPDMGYRRIRDTLAHNHDIRVNDKRIRRICRKGKIQSYVKHRYNCCTKLASDLAYVAEDILNRGFRSDRPNEKWVTDVSGVKYGIGEDDKKGKIYLRVILDLCGNRPVAFEYGNHNDDRIVFNTFDKALLADSGVKLIFHPDRGYQYTSRTFRQKIVDARMIQSMSRVGRCIDNGPMEGFWGIMEREMYYGRKYKTKEALAKAIEDHIDHHTNRRVREAGRCDTNGILRKEAAGGRIKMPGTTPGKNPFCFFIVYLTGSTPK